MQGRRSPVSALALDHDERAFYSAGWDGDAIVSPTETMKIFDVNHHNLSISSALGSQHRPTDKNVHSARCSAHRSGCSTIERDSTCGYI